MSYNEGRIRLPSYGGASFVARETLFLSDIGNILVGLTSNGL